MNEFLIGLLVALIVAVCLWAFASQAKGKTTLLCNIAEKGNDSGNKTYLADAALTTRYLIGKIGSDANHVAACGASDIPIGVIEDEPAAAEDAVNLRLLSHPGSSLMVASEAITAGEEVFTAASGKIQDLPAGAGTYYSIGFALTAASADGDVIEVLNRVPVKTVVS